jgi:hypothetical protein
MEELIQQLKSNRYLINISHLERECGVPNYAIHNCINGRGCKQFKKSNEVIKSFLRSHGIFQ